jgi:hypothetical protein
MSKVPEYIRSAYQPFSAFDSVSESCGNLAKIAVITENFNGGRGKPLNQQARDKNNIPYEQTVNGVVKYNGSYVTDPKTGLYFNLQRDSNGNAVLPLDNRISERTFDNPYIKN